MEREYPGPDTGKIELQRILNFMKENKYDYTDSLDAGDFGGCYNLIFEKKIMYSDNEGTYVNDRRIKVTIAFDTSFDYKNEYRDEKGDFIYNSENAKKAQKFIKKLMNDTYDSNSSKKGGQRKKNRKTKKK
jgi:hypothetical protein